jgi:hypothetical protein
MQRKYLELLEDMRPRPYLYIGKKSLTALWHFLLGFDMALATYQIGGEENCFPGDFHDWVAYRLHFKYSTAGWRNMILERIPDEEAALEKFFELFDDYKNRTAQVVALLSGVERVYRSGTQADLQGTEHRYPTEVSLIAYNRHDPGLFLSSNDEGYFPCKGRLLTASDIEMFMAFPSELTIVDEELFSKWEKEKEVSGDDVTS